MNSLEIDNYRSSAIFKHQFQNVTKKFEAGVHRIFSPEFYVRGLPWKIKLNLEKNEETQEVEWLGCYLCCTHNEPKYSCQAEFTFKLLHPEKLPLIFKRLANKFEVDENDWGFSKFIEWATLNKRKEIYLVSDSLTIEVHLNAEVPEGLKELSPKDKVKENLQTISNCKLADKYAILLESGDGADVTFIVKPQSKLSKPTRIKAHKNILKLHSPIFAAMFSLDMKENNLNEVKIEDMGEAAVRILLNHIYTGSLAFPHKIKVDLGVCKEVINAAEMYNFPELKEYAGMALTEFISPENAWKLYKFVKLHKADAAEKAIASYFKRNVESILAAA